MRKLATPLISIVLVFSSCEKEPEPIEFGSQMTIRNVTDTSVDVTATYYVTGTENKVERGFAVESGDGIVEAWVLNHIPAGEGNGTVDATITDLQPNTTYQIYPYAGTYPRLIGEKKTFTTESAPIPPLQIGGTGPGGGIVFFLDGLGGGMEALPVSWTTDWGCQDSIITGLNTAFGQGANNTAQIVAQCFQTECAARWCDTCTAGGYTDWFLPSIDELQSVYTNLQLPGLHNWTVGVYFSSNQFDLTYATGISFFDGATANNILKIMPGYSFFPVRTF